ncbi:MAG: peroxisomal 3,2-trans-enoyl-CoA isomerase [Myxococcota bacterium]|jgi:peroxisomal 3,2-trans-enoyl-CoA isomerase
MSELILRATTDGVTTLTMNLPKKLNGWTEPMLKALTEALSAAATDADTKALILTGTDPYYCAGVNLGAALSLGHPKKLRDMIVVRNQELFECFLDFPKPILIAANGPAIGASVTSATLCDGIIASENASFNTPFARLGVTPEGCSSEMFGKLMGETNAQRMLGKEGWVPTGAEALDAGLVQWVVPHDQLLAEAHRIAKGWIDEGRERSFRASFTRDQLKAINARESQELADAFLAAPFLKGQMQFLWKKKKRQPAAMFCGLWLSRPLWSRLL